jgi:hypothetical protein
MPKLSFSEFILSFCSSARLLVANFCAVVVQNCSSPAVGSQLLASRTCFLSTQYIKRARCDDKVKMDGDDNYDTFYA